MPSVGPPMRLRRLQSSLSVFRRPGLRLSRRLSLSLSRPTYVWRFQYRFCKEPRILLLAEAQAAVPHGPHQARLPHRRRLNPLPNAPFLPPFGAVATEFSFLSGFYLILSLKSSVVRRSLITRGGYYARHSAFNNSVNSGGDRNL